MAARPLSAMEVPLPGSADLDWVEIDVPFSLSPSSRDHCGPPTRDAAASHILLHPHSYLFWRIHESLPRTLELFELKPSDDLPSFGLRLAFPESLCPYAFVFENKKEKNSGERFVLCAITVSGVVYVIRVKNFSSYVSGSVLPENDVDEFDVQRQNQVGRFRAVAATLGCLAVGREDGTISCFQLGFTIGENAGFMYDLRDEIGIGRLWGLVSRGKSAGSVQDMMIVEVYKKALLVVIHEDGSIRVWNLFGRTKIHTQYINVSGSPGLITSRLWIGDPKFENSPIPVVIAYKTTEDADKEIVAICNICFTTGEKLSVTSELLKHSIVLEEGKLIDVKITRGKMWILKEDGSSFYDLYLTETYRSSSSGYGLLETFVADQLFQSSELASDDFMWTILSLLPIMKGQMLEFISSIFVRRIFHPCIHLSAALHRMLEDHLKHLTYCELQSLTIDDMKKEITAEIAKRGIADNPISVYCHWKSICAKYFLYWCQNSIPFSLFVDPSSGAVGLIRKNSISLFRCLEDMELLIYGHVDESGNFASSGLALPYNEHERRILLEILRCISSINHHLGRSASILYYQALVYQQMISPEDILPQLLKILDVGCHLSAGELLKSVVGADTAWEKEQFYHRNQRKFSVEMLLSFRHLSSKAGSWNGVLDVLEKFLEYLIPSKRGGTYSADEFHNISGLLLVQASSQVARVMFESAFDVLLLLGYLVNISGQVMVDHKDISRIQVTLIPRVEELLTQWLIVHLMATTPSESPILEDFSTQLSLLHIDNKLGKRAWVRKLGRYDFTLASILLLKFPSSSEDRICLTSSSILKPENFVSMVRSFSSWIVWSDSREEPVPLVDRMIELSKGLLEHHQYEAVENLLLLTEGYLNKEKVHRSVQDTNGSWCILLHLLGYSLVVQAQGKLLKTVKENKISEAVRCFFRAASGEGADQALKSFPFQTGYLHIETTSASAWRLQYYQSVMELFEQYNMCEGACQFALAALEQVDEVLGVREDDHAVESLLESPTVMRGRLWANVFKFMLDLNNYRGAYCAILSNPDEDSQDICLRRFLIVLCERGATKILCDGELPFVGLIDKVIQELVWKAERSDITARPNPYKLLYAFEMYRHNWRKAATHMYQYSVRLSKESAVKEHHHLLLALQERINALAASINALSLVRPAYAWIDGRHDSPDMHSSKKLKKNADPFSQLWRTQGCVDIQKLENEYVIVSAQYLLAQANVKATSTGSPKSSDIVHVLIESELYDMAFTLILKMWKGSNLKREMERAFIALSQKCCHARGGLIMEKDNGMLMKHGDRSSNDGIIVPSQIETANYSPLNSQWEMLEQYLVCRHPSWVKYMKLHPRLPVTVAETLLLSDPQIELPLWLVQMFKGGGNTKSWGMTGQESDAATLFRLYVDYGRFTEATNLLLEYIESFSYLRPADIFRRKQMSGILFPYAAIERLWCQLEELKSAGHMLDQCEKLMNLLRGALLIHLKQIKMDSEDAVASCQA